MSLSNATPSPTPNDMHTAPVVSPSSGAADRPGGFVERRHAGGSAMRADRGRKERRQFGSSYAGLSDPGRELAIAIDRYKLDHHRRYITCDEMLHVIRQLGYRKDEPA